MNFFSLFKRKILYNLKRKKLIDSDGFDSSSLDNLFHFFGEDQARYIIEIERDNFNKVDKILKENDIYFENIGFTQKDFFEIEGELKISTKDLFKINNEWYNKY